jgi:hypothetical protein
MKIALGNAMDAALADSDSAAFSKVITASIDEDLHSRQIWMYVLEAMHRMASTSVAVVGLNGLGAKNLFLANMQRVLLLDDCATTISDLSSQFYVSELDIGRNCAHACRQGLQQLNPAVSVTSHHIHYSSLTALLPTCTALVFSHFPLVEAEQTQCVLPPTQPSRSVHHGAGVRPVLQSLFTFRQSIHPHGCRCDTPYSVRAVPLRCPAIKKCNRMYF